MEQLPKRGLVRGPYTKHTWELGHLLSPRCNWNSAHFILLDAPGHLLWDILIRKPELWGDSWGMLGIVNEHCGTGTTLPETNIAPKNRQSQTSLPGFICLSFDYKGGDHLKTTPFGYGLKKNVRYIFHAKVLHDVHSDALITSHLNCVSSLKPTHHQCFFCEFPSRRRLKSQKYKQLWTWREKSIWMMILRYSTKLELHAIRLFCGGLPLQSTSFWGHLSLQFTQIHIRLSTTVSSTKA